MRKYAREVAFCRIYEFILNDSRLSEPDMGLFEESKLTEDDKKFVSDIYRGVTGHFGQLRDTVFRYSENFKPERIFKADLAVLVLAVYEMDYTDTPRAVCVSEAVEIAGKYSSEKSANFVNGLLAGYIKKKNDKDEV